MILVFVCIVTAMLWVWFVLKLVAGDFARVGASTRFGKAGAPAAPAARVYAGGPAVPPPGAQLEPAGPPLAPPGPPLAPPGALDPPPLSGPSRFAVDAALAPTVVRVPASARATRTTQVSAPPVAPPMVPVSASAVAPAPPMAREVEPSPVIARALAARARRAAGSDERRRRSSAGAGEHGSTGPSGEERLDRRLMSRLRRRELPPLDLAANGARVDSVQETGEVRVIARTRRPDPTVGLLSSSPGHEAPEPPASRAPIAGAYLPTVAAPGEPAREVPVITGARWRDGRVDPSTPWAAALQPHEDPPVFPGEPRGDDWLPAGARKAAAIVGSRAREAILGYPYPAPGPVHRPAGSAPGGGAEPAPGYTVVLEGDDVEAWVRERLYGGRLPER